MLRYYPPSPSFTATFVISISDLICTHIYKFQVGRALFDFAAQEDNELTFSRGDLIKITDTSNPDWWHGKYDSREGMFPANYIQLILTS